MPHASRKQPQTSRDGDDANNKSYDDGPDGVDAGCKFLGRGGCMLFLFVFC